MLIYFENDCIFIKYCGKLNRNIAAILSLYLFRLIALTNELHLRPLGLGMNTAQGYPTFSVGSIIDLPLGPGDWKSFLELFLKNILNLFYL